MSYQFNESRRQQLKKTLYKVTNWANYSNTLRNRGDINLWGIVD
jgi:hypothetical protein